MNEAAVILYIVLSTGLVHPVIPFATKVDCENAAAAFNEALPRVKAALSKAITNPDLGYVVEKVDHYTCDPTPTS